MLFKRARPIYDVNVEWKQLGGAAALPVLDADPRLEVARLAEEVARLEETVAQLNTAVRTNRIISVAIGLTMQRLGLGHADASAHLVRISQDSNVKLSAVAQELADQADPDRGRTE